MAEKNENLITRPPIVVIMGHIDHGKTTLLDFIRKTKVADAEAGGITQHVGAYEITTRDRKITFLDTPGHEAFSKIRERGAKTADIAILVIAADDKVNTQTEEALKAINETKIPFVVALNKIDKENASADRIKKELSEKEVFVEEWGGKIPCVNISAKTGQGVDDLLDMVLLMADMQELKTDPTANASGFIVESKIDPKRGITATLVVRNGTLKQGMFVMADNAVSPVRIFENFLGQNVKEATASSPIKITGFNKIPSAGSEFNSYNKKPALSSKSIEAGPPKYEVFGGEGHAVFPLIIKADAMGSVEALEKLIGKIKSEKLNINILRAEVGDITEDDIKLASGGQSAVVVGFNVKNPKQISIIAERSGIEIKLFDIIYKAEEWLIEEVKKREPIIEKEEAVGKVKILKIFRDEKTKKIIGGSVTSGKISLGKKVKIYRRDFLLGDGKIIELEHNKTKTEEIGEGEQFGALLQTKIIVAPQDTLEVIEIVKT